MLVIAHKDTPSQGTTTRNTEISCTTPEHQPMHEYLKAGQSCAYLKINYMRTDVQCQMSPSFAVPQSKCYVCSRMVIFLPLENGYSRMVSCSENHHDGSPLVSEGPGVLGHVNIA